MNMLLLLGAWLSPVELEAPGYADEALRIERRDTWNTSVQAVILRQLGGRVKVDFIDTAWSGSRIATFDLDLCFGLQAALAEGKGPSSFRSRERSPDGSIVIFPDGATYVGSAKAPYDKVMGASQGSGRPLTPFGQWAELVVSAADACRPSKSTSGK
jgi:hypothetical protein